MNIIVTGGAGFIGSNFIFYMLDKEPVLSDPISFFTCWINILRTGSYVWTALPMPETFLHWNR